MPNSPNSLHYINVSQPNQYQQAIKGIGRILLNYDSDQRIPCFGFGAKPKGTGCVSHCFPLSGNPQKIEAFGLEHLLDLYYQALTNVELSGPTYFLPIIS
jgi:hypothetical protein